MKMFIAKLYGAEVFADAECIKGRKSDGCEDNFSYEHWKFIDTQNRYRGVFPWDLSGYLCD